ncbi:MAG: M2 family metallopeptidase [Acidobacteriota bacterium]
MKLLSGGPVAFGLALVLLIGFVACSPGPADPSAEEVQAEVDSFLEDFTARHLELYTKAAQAQWQTNVRIVEGDTTAAQQAEEAQEALTGFVGSVQTIETVRSYLESRDLLTPLQVRQLEAILYDAADYPQTVPEIVAQRIGAELRSNEALFSHDFQVDGRSVSANDIDDALVSQNDPAVRQQYWEASKEVGVGLRGDLVELVSLRNQAVQGLGYDDYFAYQVSDYGMSTDEMMTMLQELIRDIWPLYRELHTWTRYELAERYGLETVPAMIPAHLVPNRWAQDWAPLVTVEGLDVDAALADAGFDAEGVVRAAEDFYVSLGFERMPSTFWERSSLYPLPADADYKKNNHASAWHVDLDQDVRTLMSVQPNRRWWETTHHELGHVYYFMAYSRPEVPPTLRAGANRAFHEAVGTLLGNASVQKPFLVDRGLIAADSSESEDAAIQSLLREALDVVVFIPFSAGTMSHFERDLYTGAVSEDQLNQRWWDYVLQYQGVEAPGSRDETQCDACTKTHIINDAAQYYDYALSYVILHQLHAHIAKNILQQDPRATNYWGSEETGEFLDAILRVGATQDWRQVLQDQLGSDLDARPMLDYYRPLLAYLEVANEGREHTLPSLEAIGGTAGSP